MYLYRYDSVKALVEQRWSDKSLRGRRRTGGEAAFPHHQIRAAHAAAPMGQAVFALSFWKTLADAENQLSRHRTGSLLQRIRSDHPKLAMFNRGDDEYLIKEAYLCWATLPINQDNPEWSPEGIPHTDIEVRLPSGAWIGMEQVGALRETGDDWFGYRVPGPYKDGPIHVKHSVDMEGHEWVLIRQQMGPWRKFDGQPSELRLLVQDFVTRFSPPTGVRWAYALEAHDHISVEEFFPRIEDQPTGFFHWFSKSTISRKVLIPNDVNGLSKAQIESLYSGMGCADALMRGERWVYDLGTWQGIV